MARSLFTGSEQIGDGTVTRSKLNTALAGSAVVAKIIAGVGMAISSYTGADAGTGDVTLTATNARTINTLSQSSGTVTIDLSLGGMFKLTLNQNLTAWSFTNPPASGQIVEARLIITQGASTAYTCVSPATSGMTAGGAWVVSAALSAVESLGLAVDSSSNVTVFPSGVYA